MNKLIYAISLKALNITFKTLVIHHVYKQEIVFKKDKAMLHVISKRCEDTF